ncbi:MAG: mevalonate kinase [Chloroflexota bacterium]|nr:mevalonate kinase [Chloroflexota bacterium]
MFERSAPGKVILCGEHSVVYGYPAIAVPVGGLRARAQIEPAPGGLRLLAADLDEEFWLRDAPVEQPLAAIARLTLEQLDAVEPDAVLTVRSELPIAAGLGSGAAVSVAVARALAAFLGHELDAEAASALAYEVEKIHHGTPSGIDNTVIAWEQPVYFVKGATPEVFTIGAPFWLLIANSGIPSSTREAVRRVRQRQDAEPAVYAAYFARMGQLAYEARQTITGGDIRALGPLLDENHALLRQLGVSLPALERLVAAARAAGALGAKLTGGGMGGNVIALVRVERKAAVAEALRQAGAVQVWETLVENEHGTQINAGER